MFRIQATADTSAGNSVYEAVVKSPQKMGVFNQITFRWDNEVGGVVSDPCQNRDTETFRQISGFNILSEDYELVAEGQSAVGQVTLEGPSTNGVIEKPKDPKQQRVDQTKEALLDPEKRKELRTDSLRAGLYSDGIKVPPDLDLDGMINYAIEAWNLTEGGEDEGETPSEVAEMTQDKLPLDEGPKATPEAPLKPKAKPTTAKKAKTTTK